MVFSKKVKVLFIIFLFLILISVADIVYGTDYTIPQNMIDFAISQLDSEYTRYFLCRTNNNWGVYMIKSDYDLYCTDTIISTIGGVTTWKVYYFFPDTNTYRLQWSGTNPGHGSMDNTHCVANFTVYANSQKTAIYYEPSPVVTYTQPSFITTISELTDFSNLQNIEINQGSFEETLYLRLYDSTNNFLIFNKKITDYEQYLERLDLSNPFSELIYRIPITALPSFDINSSNQYEFRLVYYNENDILSNVSVFFTPNTSQNVNDTTNNDINESIEKTNEKIDETNEKLDELNDNITSDDISGVSASDLPSISVNDPTEDGIGSIFTNLYNAFCTGEAQDIVFPIPFTDKNITLSATYVQNMLTNNNAGWVLTFIQAFWAYLFGRFIIKDISSKINKIKSGNIENLQTDNIKEEML